MDGIIVQLLLGIVSGTALFILAVSYLESAIRALAGRKVKRILRGTTSRPGIALVVSAVITALLQGSSVVMLLLLSLVGAGVLPLRNALAVMLGANLGTTLDTWVVVAIGFKLQLELFAVPFLLLAGTLALVGKGERASHWSRFAVGFGLFFLSLGILRDAFAADAIPQTWINAGWPLPVFSLVG
ncbi:MAG: Na/Pi symporter, partial [Bacteroidota bacterium]